MSRLPGLVRFLVISVCLTLCATAEARPPAKGKGKASAPPKKKGPAAPAEKNEAPADLLKRARARMKSLDFEAALPLLQKVINHPTADAHTRAEAALEAGICQVNVGDVTGARATFVRALDFEPSVQVPESAPPKVQLTFKAAHDERFPPPPPPPPPSVATPDLPRATPPLTPAPTAEAPARPGTELRRTRETGSLLLPVSFGAVAVAGLAVGIGAGLGSRAAATDLVSGLHRTTEVDVLMARQQSLATVSIIGYVAGGVAAAASVTSYFLTRNSADVAVAVVPGPGGISAAASFRF